MSIPGLNLLSGTFVFNFLETFLAQAILAQAILAQVSQTPRNTATRPTISLLQRATLALVFFPLVHQRDHV